MESHLELLQSLYEHLKSTYMRSITDKIENSVYLGLLNLKSKTKRMRLLLDAAVPGSGLEQDLLKQLLQLRYVEYVDQKMRITLTSNGIWEAEKSLGLVDFDRLLGFIDKKWFNCFADFKKTISDREKIILFTTLGARAFSEHSSVNLRNDEVHDGWKKAVNLVSDFLFENQIIKDREVKNLLLKKTSLHPVIHFFRYSENLPKITEGIWIGKNLNYYLDLYKDGQIAIEKLVFLFDIVFEEKIDLPLVEKVYDFCKKVAYDMSAKVFSFDKHFFATPDYDDLIRAALRRLALGT